MIRITYIQGNGYHCSCCRNEWTNYEDFDTIEQAANWLTDLEARRVIAKNSNKEYPDCRVENVVQVHNVNIEVDPEKVKALVAEFEETEKKRKENEAKILAAKKVEDDLAQLKRLQEKYPENK